MIKWPKIKDKEQRQNNDYENAVKVITKIDKEI